MSGKTDQNQKRLALIVMSDPMMRQLCRDILDGADFQVTNGIQSGSAAVAVAREQRPDIILLGQQLSDVPAREAVKWLRANRESATTPIIILGGETGSEPAADAKTLVLPRPITVARLHHILTQAFAPKRVQDSSQQVTR